MIWRGYLQVSIRKLRLPGDIKQRQSQPHVLALAKSIEDNGGDPIHAPTINAETYELIAGRDRMAALLLSGAKKAWCHVVAEVSETDAKRLEIAENLHRRRDDQDALRAQYVALAEAACSENDSVTQRGSMETISTLDAKRKGTARGAAIRAVAEAEGVTPRAIRQSLARAEADEEPADPSESIEQAAELPPPVDTYDVPVAHLAQQFAEVRVAQAAMDEADRALRKAQSALSGLKDGSALQRRLHAAVYQQIHNAAENVRYYRPTQLCPFCKALPHLVERCSCTHGFAGTYDAGFAIAPELLRRGDAAMVSAGGKLTSLSAATAPREKPVKKLRIEFEGALVEAAKEDPPSVPLPGVVEEEELF